MNPVTPYLLPLIAALVVVALVLTAAHRWDIGDWPAPGAGEVAAKWLGGTWVKVPVFTAALVGAFIWSGDVVTGASGGGRGPAALPTGVSVAAGEQIFWSTGKCHTCHSVGTRGGKIRGPNLGGQPGTAPRAAPAPAAEPAGEHTHSGPEPAGTQVEAAPEPAAPHSHAPGQALPPIGAHAQAMADERAVQLGHPMTGAEYLVESIANPSAFVAPGFKDEMPKVYEPPISLTPDQITSVILYLQSLGGTPDPSAIHLPPEILRASRTPAAAVTWKPYLPGDSLRGREIFFDPNGFAACARCHRVRDQGGNVGPDLTSIAGSRTPQAVVEKLLDPNKEITSGYDMVRLHLDNGRELRGVISRQAPDSVWLGTAEGKLVLVDAHEILHRQPVDSSIHPADFAQKVNLKDFHDLLAFLGTLRPFEAGTGDSARGRTLFFDAAGRAACARCHRVKNEGGEVGPELTQVVGIRSPQFILESILDVNKHIASGFETMQIKTSSGRTVEGVIVRSTAASVSLGTSDGKIMEVPTADIVQRQKLSTSLMPDSLGKKLSPKELADLMAYLETLR
ncbi:MAG: c-type cytochrome [Gemmatimonadetes bacterium]|nr:c-type cytochrome [Gemmatimonadota bacterium]